MWHGNGGGREKKGKTTFDVYSRDLLPARISDTYAKRRSRKRALFFRGETKVSTPPTGSSAAGRPARPFGGETRGASTSTTGGDGPFPSRHRPPPAPRAAAVAIKRPRSVPGRFIRTTRQRTDERLNHPTTYSRGPPQTFDSPVSMQRPVERRRHLRSVTW